MKTSFIKHIAFLFLLLASLAFACNNKQMENTTDNNEELDVVNVKIRNGLPNFFNKIEKGEKVNIAYLGGSITEMEGWRDKTFNWFKGTYPSVQFTQIMASVSGTGSEFGVYRIDEHVLNKDPDLVFVEFSTNDELREYNDIQASIEGIVRKIWMHNPETDICFVHTVTNGSYSSYLYGKYPTSAQAIEDMGEYYKIPTINLAKYIIKKIMLGEIVIDGSTGETDENKTFANDGIHPTDIGHELYKEVIIDCMNTMSEIREQKPHNLIPVKNEKNLENATMILSNSAQISRFGTWNDMNSVEFNKYYNSPVLNTADKASTLEFSFQGTAFGIADIVGPKGAVIEISIDGKIHNINRFDDFCHYYRINYLLIDDLPYGNHNVRIKLSSQKPNKREILKNGYFKFTDEQLNEMTGLDDYELFIIGFLYS